MFIPSDVLVIISVIAFFVAVVLRLLDRSGIIFLNHKIYIESSYPATSLIKEYVTNTTNIEFKNELLKVLRLRKFHKFFIILFLLGITSIIFKVIF